MLHACSSNQSSGNSQNHYSQPEHFGNAQQKVTLEKSLSDIPADGKLRPEHIKMYVSVRIKQEQLRYQRHTENPASGELEKTNLQNSALTDDIETIAIDDFGFDSKIYYWSKKVIQETLQNYSSSSSSTAAELTDNDTLVHNLTLLKKHRDELRFAHSYRLKLKHSSEPDTALKNVSNNQLAFTQKPSS